MIQSIQRAAKILSLFSLNKSRLGITEISKQLNLPKGTVQGLVQTMHQEGLLGKDEETRKYKIGFKIYELGVIFSGSLDINHKAIDLAHQLSKDTDKLVRLAILDGNSALVTLDLYPRIVPFFSRQVGPRLPLYCTAVGKALLAFFKEEDIHAYIKQERFVQYTKNTKTKKKILLDELKMIRAKGYSVNREENVLGRASIAAPIFDREGFPVASIGVVVSPRDISSEDDENRLSSQIMKTTFEISQQLRNMSKPDSVFFL